VARAICGDAIIPKTDIRSALSTEKIEPVRCGLSLGGFMRRREFISLLGGAALLVALMLTVCGSIVRAGPFEAATDAYKRNDDVTALRLLRPLVEQGNVAAQN